MLSKLRVKRPFVYAVVIYLIFFVSMNTMGFFSEMVTDVVFAGELGALGDQVSQFVCELVPALIFILVLKRTGRLGLLSKKGRGFAAGLATGGYCFAFIAYVVVQIILAAVDQGYGVDFTLASAACVVAMLMVGVTEELEARALIGETFLEHYGTTRSGAMKAALASGLIFGAMHLTNLVVGDIPGTFMQVGLCVTGGFLYGAIYFRSGNIWAIALIHGLNDVAASTADWLFGGGVSTMGAAAQQVYTAADVAFFVVVAVLDLSVAFFLLRPKKAGQVAEAWPELEK